MRAPIILLSVLMSFSLVACKKSADASAAVSEAKVAQKMKQDGAQTNATAEPPVAQAEKELSSKEPEQYQMDSWKSIIPDNCVVFYDGCNQCRRSPGSDMAACTKRMCVRFDKPKCIKMADGEGGAPLSRVPRLLEYHCDQGRFKVFYDEYRTDDQRMKLAENQMMISDLQSRTTYLLTREKSASGIKYQNDSVTFWGKGSEAVVAINGEKAYDNCMMAVESQG